MKNTVSQKIDARIKAELNGLGNNKTYLLVVKPENYNEAGIALIKYLSNTLKKPGIIVTFAKPGSELLQAYSANQIELKGLHIIDATGIKPQPGLPEYILVSSPTSLVELSIKITAELKKGEHGFLLIDELTTLARHNTPATAEHFVHFLINKIKLHEMSGIVMLAINSQQESNGMDEIKKIVDDVVEI